MIGFELNASQEERPNIFKTVACYWRYKDQYPYYSITSGQSAEWKTLKISLVSQWWHIENLTRKKKMDLQNNFKNCNRATAPQCSCNVLEFHWCYSSEMKRSFYEYEKKL